MRKTALSNEDSGIKIYRFENKHGEKFQVIKRGILIYIKGDETDNELIELFNPHFDIYSSDELENIGNALIELSKED